MHPLPPSLLPCRHPQVSDLANFTEPQSKLLSKLRTNSWKKEKPQIQTLQWRKGKSPTQDNPLRTAWTLEYLVFPPTGCNHLHPRSCGNDHSRKGIMLRSWALPPIFCHFILRFRSLVPHSFPYAPLGPPLNHLTSHLMDHLTILQSIITCHHSAVRSTPQHRYLTHYGLPAHCHIMTDHQLMMELYLELPAHDEPYYT